MSGRQPDLALECAVFCRYLLATGPSGYVVDKYLEAHRARPDLAARDRFDAPSLELAVLGPGATRVADAYVRLFARRGLLRRKLSLLLAILENSPELHRRVEAVDAGGRLRVVPRLVGELALWGLSLAAGLFLLLPVHALHRGRLTPGGGSG